jgi:hypothetical protein
MNLPTEAETTAYMINSKKEIDFEVERITADVYRRVKRMLDSVEALNKIKIQIEREWEENDRA